jgi:hypothetical protein
MRQAFFLSFLIAVFLTASSLVGCSGNASGGTNGLDGKRYEAVVNNEDKGYQYTLPVEFSGDEVLCARR